MTMQDSARSLLRIAYKHLDPRTAMLDLPKFWEDAELAANNGEIHIYPTFLYKRNNAGQLANLLQREAEVEPLASLHAKIPEHDQASYDAYLAELASEGRLPILVEHQRRTAFVKDMRLAVTTLYDDSPRR